MYTLSKALMALSLGTCTSTCIRTAKSRPILRWEGTLQVALTNDAYICSS